MPKPRFFSCKIKSIKFEQKLQKNQCEKTRRNQNLKTKLLTNIADVNCFFNQGAINVFPHLAHHEYHSPFSASVLLKLQVTRTWGRQKWEKHLSRLVYPHHWYPDHQRCVEEESRKSDESNELSDSSFDWESFFWGRLVFPSLLLTFSYPRPLVRNSRFFFRTPLSSDFVNWLLYSDPVLWQTPTAFRPRVVVIFLIWGRGEYQMK